MTTTPSPDARPRSASPCHAKTTVAGLRWHHVSAGPIDSPSVLLVHGWPQTWREWEPLIADLATDHRVVAVDLAGFGDSDTPTDRAGPIALADQLAALITTLATSGDALAPTHLVGHDLGGLVAYTLARRHPALFETLTLIDTPLPLLGVPHPGWPAIRDRLWHLSFHSVPDIPEMLVTGRERQYLGWFFSHHSHDPSAITTDAFEDYLRCYSAPGGLRAGFDFARHLPDDAATLDEPHADLLTTPTLLLGGEHSMSERMAPAARTAIAHLTSDVVPDSGHWVPEENPQWLADRVRHHWHEAASPA